MLNFHITNEYQILEFDKKKTKVNGSQIHFPVSGVKTTSVKGDRLIAQFSTT